MKFYRKRKRSYLLSLDDPFPADPQPEPVIRKNIVAEAVLFYNYLKEDPARNYTQTGQRFGVSRARVSQLMSLIERLPKEFIDNLKDCQDQQLLQIFSGRTLLKIAKLNTPERRQERIEQLLPKNARFSIPAKYDLSDDKVCPQDAPGCTFSTQANP
ncbi:MAG: hypothetical protein JW734_06580 [Candidatus Omnitrophica bacterium]|nr:hypothetical protein [Candidatus Omnitrophota bacterium]